MSKRQFKMNEKAALILEGGGMRGAFTAGVLDNLMERKILFPYTIGVSAGACNGLSYMSMQRGRSKYSYTKLMEQYKYIGLGKLLFSGNIMDFKLLFHTFPEKIYPYDYEALASTTRRFEMVTTSCRTGKACYYDERRDPRRIIDIVKASSSLPFVAPIAYVDGEPMMDGGIADSIPLLRARSQGFDNNLIVLTRNRGYRKPDKPTRVPFFMYRKYPAVRKAIAERNAMYNRQIALVEKLEEAGEVTVIRPIQPITVDRMERNTDKLLTMYNEGYNCAADIEFIV
ncbi:MAG: patatin family protein [Bacteroidaceae bacterium]|nr:patatin family protein [Bacteroidaceae bacterium]